MYMDAFRQWKDRHGLLLSSVQDYLCACITLETALSSPPDSYSSKAELETSLLRVNEDLPTIFACRTQLQEASNHLSRLRNRSTALAPINLLPPEILSQIFVAVNEEEKSCIHDATKKSTRQIVWPNVFASVNASWRLIAITTPRLWSHVDIVANNHPTNRSMSRAQCWLERASNAPVTMHIQDMANPPLDIDRAIEIAALLSPYSRQLHSLSIRLRSNNGSLVREILRPLLADSSAASTLESLVMHGQKSRATGSYDVFPTHPTPTNLLALATVRTLVLSNLRVDWASAVYSGLVELDIHSLPSEIWPTTEQMVVFLSSSPSIRRLRLSNLGVVRHASFKPPGPILLSELEELNLLNLTSGLHHLLPLIRAGPKQFNASFVQTGSAGEYGAIHSFFNQSSVTTLHFRGIGRGEITWAGQLLGDLPYLTRLAVGRTTVSFNSLEVDLAAWPRLNTLYLLGCSLLSTDIPETFNSHRNLQLLSMWACSPPHLEHEDEDGDGDDFEEEDQARMLAVAAVLGGLVPRSELLSKSDNKPVAQWSISQ